MARLRHCGRWAFWRRPFGPWLCSVCFLSLADGPLPRAAEWAFWEAVDDLVARVEARRDRAEERRLLPLFGFKGVR
jgi:hypothetical protein